MKDDRGELDLTKQIDKLTSEKQNLQNEISLIKGINFQSEKQKEIDILNKTIETLRQRIKELLSINNSHQELMGRQIVENQELKRDNKNLAKQIEDYFNVRMNDTRKSGM